MSVAFRASVGVLTCAMLGLIWLQRGVAVGAVIMGTLAIAYVAVAVWAVMVERRRP